MSHPKLLLVLGGARSGKSTFAEAQALKLAPRCAYVATAEARDIEMAKRIADHKARRGANWRTVEAPLAPLSALPDLADDESVLLDCLTLWLSNQMEAGGDLEEETRLLLRGLRDLKRPVVMVSNEIGMGLVPDTSLGRAFRDAQGRLNQQAAKMADTVVFVAAGLPLVLKGTLP